MFRIKMTAARTNPQQIREVRIDSEKTVGELLELVRILYEYGDVRGSLLNEAGASQSPEAKQGADPCQRPPDRKLYGQIDHTDFSGSP